MTAIIDQRLVSGSKELTTTAQPLSADTVEITTIIITARQANTADIRISGDDVAVDNGQPLAPGEMVSMPFSDLANIWVIAESGTQNIDYTYVRQIDGDGIPFYCSYQDVKDILPNSLPATIDDALILKAILQGSAEVDAKVGGRFPLDYHDGQKFPNYNDSPPTPSIVSEAAANFAAYRVYRRLKELNRIRPTDGPSYSDIIRGDATRIVNDIASGKSSVYVSGAEVGAPPSFGYEQDETDHEKIFTDENFDTF